jgi:uncharacterized protein (TIGR03435 family)
MMQRKWFLPAAMAGLMSTSMAYGQEKTSRLTFEVASIKATQPGGRGGAINALPAGQGYIARNANVKLMISLMYKVPMRQITGGPDWLDSDGFDVDAKADHPYNLDDLHTMYQNMLADRFKLKFHKEAKEGNVYALTVDKSGLKMKLNPNPEPFQIPLSAGKDGSTVGTRVPMQYLCWWLGQVVQRDERPVVNLSGLDGNYDFTLSFMPELPPDFPKENLPPGFLDRPSIFDALKTQLGLKLTPQKGPVEFYVIDHVEKPAAN